MSRLLLSVFLLVVAGSLSAQSLPEGKGKTLLEQVCSDCHGADAVAALHQSRAGWKDLVDDMVAKGAMGSPDQIATIVEYLATNFPAQVNVNKGTAKEIAEGLELTAAESEAIVKYRQTNGNFKDFDSLAKVDGIDKAKLETKKDRIKF